MKCANAAGWKEVRTDIAREKVSHLFRNRRIATSGAGAGAGAGNNNNGWKEIRFQPVTSSTGPFFGGSSSTHSASSSTRRAGGRLIMLPADIREAVIRLYLLSYASNVIFLITLIECI